MTVNGDEPWFALVDTFQSAALGELSWDSALQLLADATGSQSAQLIGRKTDLTVVYNVMTNLDPATQKLAIERQPINPRPRVVKAAPVFQAVADRDVIAPEECRRNPFYQEVLRPCDRPFFCATVLETVVDQLGDTFLTLGVMRSQSDGYISTEQRHTFGMLARHVGAALRLHAALERSGAALLAGAMEALAIPLFLCDRTGRVRSLTPAAEALISRGNGLELKDGRLRAARADETRGLHAAIDAALPANREPGPPALRTVAVHGRKPGMAPVILDVFALPRRLNASFLCSTAPQVLIVACGQRKADVRRKAILGTIYGLTGAETEVAELLAAGQSPQIIAAQRGVSVGTVRAQLRAILGKCRVRRQAELAARLNQL